MVHIMLPFLVLPVLRRHARHRPRLHQGGGQPGCQPDPRVLDACSSRCRCRGCLAGSLIVFIICLGFYVTPAVLGGGKVIMVSNQIANDIELFFNWGAASALGVVLLAADAAVPVARLAPDAPRPRAGRGRAVSWLDAAASPTQVTHRARLWLYVLAAARARVPDRADADRGADVVLGRRSTSSSRRGTGRCAGTRTISRRPSWMQATVTSFKAASLTSLVATPLGTLAAYGLFVVELPARPCRARAADHAR